MATEMVQEFNARLDEYARHLEYIAKAQAQAAKFSPAVIQKVIGDHQARATNTANQILPGVPDLVFAIAELEGAKDQINRDQAGSVERMEELELRAAIGEISEQEFADASTDLRQTLDGAAERIQALDAERAEIQAALDRWVALATSAGQDTGLRDESAASSGDTGADDATLLGEEPLPTSPQVVEEEGGGHLSQAHTREDVSAVFSTAPAEAPPADEESLIEVAEAGEGTGDEASSDVDFGFDDGDDFLAEGEGAEVQLDLVEENADPDDDIAVDLGGAEEVAAAPVAEEEQGRRALLLYQEGTAEEQIYPFAGDVLTVGRGRDNDIQIKNDSKVSRFHCRLFRKGGNYYIEDNKSSNGTLVNGELITERRLFGGEEVIIGETFFRFRIM